jgi:superfamily I DNA/RNA helicase
MFNILEEKTSFINYKLCQNCRNTKQIGAEIQYITGYNEKNYLNLCAEGIPVNYFTFNDNQEQISKVNELINRLVNNEKVAKNEIIILSQQNFDNSGANDLKYNIDEYSDNNSENIRFSTIHSFKGMESNIIVLIDISTYRNNNLIYIGFSRAKAALYIFESKKAHEERTELLLKGVKNA